MYERLCSSSVLSALSVVSMLWLISAYFLCVYVYCLFVCMCVLCYASVCCAVVCVLCVVVSIRLVCFCRCAVLGSLPLPACPVVTKWVARGAASCFSTLKC